MTKRESSTRSRILRAAIEEIAETGIGGARTRSIAERAGVNSALVHYHFRTMEDLIAEAAASVVADLADMAAAGVGAPTVAEGLDALNEMITATDLTAPGWRVLLEVMVNTPRNPRLGGFVLGWLAEYRAAMTVRLERAVADGELPAGVDTEGLALALMALYDGLGLYGYVDPNLDVRRAGRAVADLLIRPEKGTPP